MKTKTLILLLSLFTLILPLSAAELEPSAVLCRGCSALHGDFNGDGLDDLLLRNQILFNIDGAFAPAVTAEAINEEHIVRAIADFNADGLDDVIVQRRGRSTGPGQPSTAAGADRLLLNRGAAEFERGPSLPSGGVLQAGDFTGDGKPDLVLFRGDAWGLARGNGDGTFAEVQNIPFPDGIHSSRHEPFGIGDLNGDGRIDLVVARHVNLYFYFAKEDGTFDAPVKRFTMLEALGPRVADVNGDAKNDIVFISSFLGLSRATVLYGDGAGRFPKVAHLRVPAFGPREEQDPELRALVTGDFFPGGSNEIAVGAARGDVVVLSAMNDVLTEVARVASPPVGFAATVRAGEFSRDGGLELYVIGNDGDAIGSQVYLVFTRGSVEVPDPQRGTWRSRAVGRFTSALSSGEYDVAIVDGACVPAVAGRWTFVREGLFVHVTGPNLGHVEAAAVDGEIGVRLFIEDMGRTRLFEGSLFPKDANRLGGNLVENNPPCGGLWTYITVDATRR